ncbi:hypothetical protein T4A_9494 [Trichinella pseudospiralis]|nr:hypothetical protein T4A_9494 [Trichinella pseudospiralis]KRY94223.1 hypothetical protein T4C_207 [Trichinella pseudospiralis]KRY94331.1 hypothetical protein T4C_8848 [Trichinella pseudospiralis]
MIALRENKVQIAHEHFVAAILEIQADKKINSFLYA